MKVKQLKKYLEVLNDEDQIFALFWEKDYIADGRPELKDDEVLAEVLDCVEGMDMDAMTESFEHYLDYAIEQTVEA